MKYEAALVALAALTLSACSSQRLSEWAPVSRPFDALVPEDDETGFQAPGRVSSACSAVIVGAAVEIPFGGMCLVALALALGHRRRARALGNGGATRRDGPAVIAGVVEPADEGDDPVLVVRIHQHGTESWTKTGLYHTWAEVTRDVVARPFRVRCDDGTSVRVEPDPRVVLHESVLEVVRHTVSSRSRVAELRPGASVRVSGDLTGGRRAERGGAYRAAAERVLRAPLFGPLVVSAEALDEGARLRQRFHTRSAAALGAAWVAIHAIVVPGYGILLLDGRRVDASPTEARAWRADDTPDAERRYAVRARVPDHGGISVSDECSQWAYHRARVGSGTVPFVLSEHAPSVHQIGPRATLSRGQVCALVAVMLSGFVYPLVGLRTRPWYLKRRVNDTGRGRLDSAT
jgi:hypothetical protein